MSNPPPVPPPEPQNQPPVADASPGVLTGSLCPQCREHAGAPMKFTWWGGVLGPRILNHHKCGRCGYTFNGRSGGPNTIAILIYTVVVLAIIAVIGFLASQSVR